MKSITLGRSLGEAVQESGPRSQSVCYVLWALRFRQMCLRSVLQIPRFHDLLHLEPVLHILQNMYKFLLNLILNFKIEWQKFFLRYLTSSSIGWPSWADICCLFLKSSCSLKEKIIEIEKHYFSQLLCCIILNNLETRKKNGWKISFLHKFCSFSTFTIFWVIFHHRMLVPNDRSLFLFVPTKIGPKTLWTISCSS